MCTVVVGTEVSSNESDQKDDVTPWVIKPGLYEWCHIYLVPSD